MVRTSLQSNWRTDRPLNESRFKKVIKQRCVCIGIVTRAVQVPSQGLIFLDLLLLLLFKKTCNLIYHLCHLNPFRKMMQDFSNFQDNLIGSKSLAQKFPLGVFNMKLMIVPGRILEEYVFNRSKQLLVFSTHLFEIRIKGHESLATAHCGNVEQSFCQTNLGDCFFLSPTSSEHRELTNGPR